LLSSSKKILSVCSLLILFLLFSSGCGDDEKCESRNTACGEFTACCTSDQCYYKTSDGTRFNCNGTDCQEAAELVAEYMCSTMSLSSPEEFEAMVDEILRAAEAQQVRTYFKHK